MCTRPSRGLLLPSRTADSSDSMLMAGMPNKSAKPAACTTQHVGTVKQSRQLGQQQLWSQAMQKMAGTNEGSPRQVSVACAATVLIQSAILLCKSHNDDDVTHGLPVRKPQASISCGPS